MTLDIYQVDAFTSEVFGGNPAAVIPLEEWLSDKILQQIATENNLSETAFFVIKQDFIELRWFTPVDEVNLCGHATLATAFVLFEELNYPHKIIHFSSKSGILKVKKEDHLIQLNFPLDQLQKLEMSAYSKLFNTKPVEAWKGKEDILLVFKTEEEVRDLKPNLKKISKTACRGVIATSKGENVDFVSRFFTPQLGINEDPVTGSAHTTLAPFWNMKNNKKDFHARQISNRGGELFCKIKDNRVLIAGQAICYMKGKITFQI